MDYKCIIFDFDGTLADTNVGIVRTFQETFRRMGMAVPSEERISSTIGLNLKDGFFAAVDGLTDAQADQAVEIYRSIFPQIAFPVITAFPGIVEALAELKSRGYILAVATSRSHYSLEALADQTGVAPFFVGLYGAEDTARHKPYPDLALHILSELKLQPSEALVVGDATYDVLMGKGAGCSVCAVTWGNQTREKLATAGPDYIIDHISELLELL